MQAHVYTTDTEKQTCHKCGSENLITTPRVFRNGTSHLEVRCDAGHFIQFQWSGRPLERMPFGRHKGQRIRDLPRGYGLWLLRKANIGNNLRRSIEKLTGEVGCLYPGWA